MTRNIKFRKTAEGVSYKSARLRESTYDELVKLRDDLVRKGTDVLPPGVRGPVTAISDVVDCAVRALRKVMR